jgi:hypothetical protein
MLVAMKLPATRPTRVSTVVSEISIVSVRM